MLLIHSSIKEVSFSWLALPRRQPCYFWLVKVSAIYWCSIGKFWYNTCGWWNCFCLSLDNNIMMYKMGVSSWCNGLSTGLQNCGKRVQTPVMLLCPLLDKYHWERHEPPYPLSYGLSSTTTFLLEGWIWHQITQEDWYAIKQQNKNHDVQMFLYFHLYKFSHFHINIFSHFLSINFHVFLNTFSPFPFCTFSSL